MKNKNTKSVKSDASVKGSPKMVKDSKLNTLLLQLKQAKDTVKKLRDSAMYKNYLANKQHYEVAGRPAYQPKFPRKSKWTFNDFCETNGINLETGKGEKCTILTLRKFIKRDLSKNDASLVINTGELAKPNSESGLGRKSALYCLREKAIDTTDTENVTVNVGTDPASTTADYEATKAALLAPTVTPVIDNETETAQTIDTTSVPITTENELPAQEPVLATVPATELVTV